MTISIAEYAARVRRLRRAMPNLESGYNDDEGLTLVYTTGPDQRRVVLSGETSIIETAEFNVTLLLKAAAEELHLPATYTPFKRTDR